MDFNIAWLTTNRSCNNKCNWCYAINSLCSSTIMPIEKAKKAVDELKKRNVKKIVLIGGEPTIYPHFLELIEYIHQNNIIVTVASNGRKFKDIEFARKTIAAGVDRIDFSLKAITEQEYLEKTKVRGLEEMLKGYQNLRSMGFKPSLSYVIVNDDKKEFDNLVNFLIENNLPRISLQFVKPVLEENQKDKILDIRKMGKFVEYIYNKLNDTSIDYSLELSFPLCLIDPDVLEKLLKSRRFYNGCHVPRGSGINFDENFKVIPCNHFGEFPFSETPINFSKENSIEELMETEIVKEFRSKARSYPAEKCKACNLWNTCGGGCFTRWLTLNPNDYIK